MRSSAGYRSPGAEHVTMLGELVEEPPAPDSARLGVVEDVDLPDPEADLAIGGREHYGFRIRVA